MSVMVSIIVPVYNVEIYLRRCLDSLIFQTYKNIEIIVVDDGSTDNSSQICQEYASKNNNIKYFKKVNGGLSSARNYGIKKSKGELLYFVDSDDWLDLECVQKLISLYEKYNSDITMCGYYELDDNSMVIHGVNGFGQYTLNREEGIKKLVENTTISSHAWDKLFKRELFDDVEFPNGKFYEDIYAMHKIFLKANLISHLNEPCYYYYQRKSSICHCKNVQSQIDKINAFIDRYYCLEKNNMLKDYYKITLIRIIKKEIIYICKDFPFLNKKKNISRFIKENNVSTDRITDILYTISFFTPLLIHFFYKIRENNGFFYRFCKNVAKKKQNRIEISYCSETKTRFLIFGAPEYNNLGDHAIYIAEEDFLKKHYPNTEVISFTENSLRNNLNKILNSISKNDIIFFQGGGNIGDQYGDQEKLRKKIFKRIKQNKIIVMPSTVYIKDVKNEKRILKKYKSKNVFIFLRERFSYNYLYSKIGSENIYLTPDIVLSLNKERNHFRGDRKLLYVIRSDVEAKFELKNILYTKKQLELMGYNVTTMDTCLDVNIKHNASRSEVNRVIDFFGNFDYVITDRLHGVIFSYLSGTHCIAINNYNYKIKGIVEWLDNANTILIDDINDTINTLDFFEKNKNEKNDNQRLHQEFSKLKEQIDFIIEK